MIKLSTCGAEAWPISHAGRDGRRQLEQIVVMSEHGDGRGAVHLTADQALYVQSRLSQIAVMFLPHHRCNGAHLSNQATTHPDRSVVHPLAVCGAEAWPVVSEDEGFPRDLEKVVIESDRPDGRASIHLSPEQALYVEERLTHLTLDFLHDKGWGGEDARSQ
jgi:hypothetical protein